MSAERRGRQACGESGGAETTRGAGPRLIKVDEQRPEGYSGSCLRPLGLCDLGSCDTCWYRPDHPRFQRGIPDGERE